MSDGEGKPLLSDVYNNVDDYTFYKRKDDKETNEVLKRYCRATEVDEDGNILSWEGRIPIKGASTDIAWGRVLACRSFEKNYWSLTFRTKRTKSGKRYLLGQNKGNSKYAPNNEPEEGTLNTCQEICNRL